MVGLPNFTIVLFLTLVGLVTSLSAKAHEVSREQIEALVKAVAENPVSNEVRGVPFSYREAMRNHQTAAGSWLNPNNPEQYSFAGIPNLAPNPLPALENNARAFQMIKEDYLRLLAEGRLIGAENMSLMRDFKQEPRDQLHLELGEAIYKHNLFAVSSYSKLLTILNKELWDHRFISTFFFTTTIHREHRPLESMNSLSRSSVRAGRMIERMLSSHRAELATIEAELTRLVELAGQSTANWTGLRGEVGSVASRSEAAAFRLNLIYNKLYLTVQYSNDVVRAKNLNKAALIKEMVDLGHGLRSAIRAIEAFASANDKLKLASQSFEFDGIKLSDPLQDLKEIFGLDATYIGGATTTILHRDSVERQQFALKNYHDTVVSQYILAAGSIMSGIRQIPEGRGAFADRLMQEVRFRWALLSSPKPVMETTNTALIAPNENPQFSGQALQRRDFASPALKNNRQTIEDELWRVFFASAEISDLHDLNETCDAFLLGATPAHRGGIEGLF